MRFNCKACNAKYQIADEKVAGKTVRMKCRKCGHVIQVRSKDGPEGLEPVYVTESTGGDVSEQQGAPASERPASPGGRAAAPSSPGALGGLPSARPSSPGGLPPARPSSPGGLPSARSPLAARPSSVGVPPRPGGPPRPGVPRAQPSGVLGARPAPAGLAGGALGGAGAERASAALGTPGSRSSRPPARPAASAGTARAAAVPLDATVVMSQQDEAPPSTPAAHVAPAAPGEAPEWFVGVDGEPLGPITRAALGEQIRRGKVTAESLVWREELPDWRPLRTFPELAGLVAPPESKHSDPIALTRAKEEAARKSAEAARQRDEAAAREAARLREQERAAEATRAREEERRRELEEAKRRAHEEKLREEERAREIAAAKAVGRPGPAVSWAPPSGPDLLGAAPSATDLFGAPASTDVPVTSSGEPGRASDAKALDGPTSGAGRSSGSALVSDPGAPPVSDPGAPPVSDPGALTVSDPGAAAPSPELDAEELRAAGLPPDAERRSRRRGLNPMAYAFIAAATAFGAVSAWFLFGQKTEPGPIAQNTTGAGQATPTDDLGSGPTRETVGEAGDPHPSHSADGTGGGAAGGPRLSGTFPGKMGDTGADPQPGSDTKTEPSPKAVKCTDPDDPFCSSNVDGPSKGPTQQNGGESGAPLSPAQVNGTVSKFRGSLMRRCSAMVTKGNAKVSATIRVAPSGAVSSVSTSGGAEVPGLASCVQSRIQNWTFPQAGGPTTVNVSFNFLSG